MKTSIDDIVATLSIDFFRVPPAAVEAARDISAVEGDRSLIDALSVRGFLSDLERDFLRDLSNHLADPEALTASREVADPEEGTIPMGVANLALADPFINVIPNRSYLHEEGASRYRVIEEQGRGGMGRVLSVWDNRMAREVALKELLPGRVGNGKKDGGSGSARGRVIARFLQEAQVTGRLQHPSIIPVYEIGERPDGTLYYTMKFVRGQTLKEAIADATDLEGRMALLPHYVSLCQAMAYAHANGVIHRDLKPSNIMIGEFGETLVIDWGLAKELGGGDSDPLTDSDEEAGASDAGAHGLTMDGQLLGTPHYMSPEQASGKQATLDERSDVYSLGAVLYQLLTGSRPFEALSRIDVLRQVVKTPPPAPETLCPQIPAALAAICKQAMALDPNQRYSSARVLADEILRFQSGAVVAAHEYGVREHLLRLAKKHRPVVLTTMVSALLLLGVLSYTVYSLHRGQATEHRLRVASEQERYGMSIGLAQQSLEEMQYDEVLRVLEACPPEYRGWEWGRLQHELLAMRQTIDGHTADVADGALSSDGKYLITVDFGGTALLWSLPEFRRVRAYSVSAETWAVAFHPEGNEFVTTGIEGKIRRWRVDSDRMIAEYEPTGASCCALVYTADGRYLMSAGTDDKISQWDMTTGKIVRTFAAPSAVINHLALSPDGRWLAAGSEGGLVMIWDWARGALVHALDAHSNSRQHGVQGTIGVGFSPDSSTIASGGCDGTAKVWDLHTGELRFTLDGFVDRVWSATFTPDGKTIATNASGVVRFWDATTGVETTSWIRGEGTSKRTLFLHDGSAIVTTGGADRICRWSQQPAGTGTFLPGDTALTNSVRFSPDGAALVATTGQWKEGGDGRVLLWKRQGDEARAPLRVLEGGEGWTHPVAFHPDGRQVSAGDGQGRLHTWDWHTGAPLDSRALADFPNGVRCLDYSPDGTALAVAGWADRPLPFVNEYATEPFSLTRQYVGGTMEIDSVAYSPDGRYVAAGSRDGVARVWDRKTGEMYRAFAMDYGWVYGVAFSPDSRFLATSHHKSLVMIWDLGSGEEVLALGGLLARANKVTFSPDGKRVVACDTNMVKVWSAITGAALMTLPHGAYDVAFSPDGRSLAAAGIDGNVGLWHADPWLGEGSL